MLRAVLQAIESADGPIHLGALSQQLGIERSALEGMISYWVQKGRLQSVDDNAACGEQQGHCGGGCGGSHTCSFVARMPKSYTIQLSPAKQS